MDIHRPLSRCIALSLAGILFLNPIVTTAAQLAVDKAAGGNTHIGQAGNGVPIVNIATPNGAGVSHNKFRDYNVGQQGLILNNASGRTTHTQLGGVIVGNGNLRGRAAQKIINEVTGASPSQLRGYTEVAGQRAHVIVANPHGITCSGCGFINTPRATLTTGKPILNGGRLHAYDVDAGHIAIEGAGLNATNVDQFELITRSAKLNADLYAQQLDIVAGRNQVNAQTLAITAKANDGSTKPRLAIDSKALGGMYAGAIRLVGSEQGVGVKLAGNMAASTGDIQIDASGKLSLGRISSQGDLKLAGQSIELTGNAYVGGTADVRSAQQLVNHQRLAARERIVLNVASLDNTGVIDAGVEPGKPRNTRGDLSITSQTLRNSGSLVASGNLSATATQRLDNQGGTLKGGTTRVTAGQLDNRGGTAFAEGDVTVALRDRLDNRGGRLESRAGNLDLQSASLDNREGGRLASAQGRLKLLTGQFDNRAGLTQADSLELRASQGVHNQHGHLSALAGDSRIVTSDFFNQGGGLYAAGLLHLSGRQFFNQGSVQGQGGKVGAERIDFSLAGDLDNRFGQLESQSSLHLAAGSIINRSGSLRALGNREISQLKADRLDNRTGVVEIASHDLDLQFDDLANTGGRLLHAGSGTFGLSARQVTRAGGELVTNGLLDIRANTWTNSSLLQADRLSLDIDEFQQTADGKLLAVQSFSGRGNNWRNEGVLSSDGTFSLNLRGTYSGNGRANGLGALSLSAANFDLGNSGRITAGADATVSASNQLANQGRITAAGNLTTRAATLNNRGTLGSAGALRVDATTLLNERGLIFSGDDLQIRANDITNRYGDVFSLGALDIARDDAGNRATSLRNLSGVIESRRDFSLRASLIENRRDVLEVESGLYTAKIEQGRCIEGVNAGDCSGKRNSIWVVTQRDKTDVTASSAMSQLLAGGSLVIEGGTLRNASSLISTGGDLAATVDVFDNHGVQTGELETVRTLRTQRLRGQYIAALQQQASQFTDRYWYERAGFDPARAGEIPAALNAWLSRSSFEHEFASQGPTPIRSDDHAYAGVIQAAGNVTIKADQRLGNGVLRTDYTYVGSGRQPGSSAAGASGISVIVPLTAQLPPDLARRQVNPVTLPGFSVPQGDKGLFRLTSGKHPYLIETNPALTDLRQFLNSDYLLNALGVQPNGSKKRLGDGLYEQRLIREAVVARTGQRYLDGLNNDEALFRYLMDNAIAYKDALQLQLGAGLTAAQVAALTHDIVWLQEVQVNGQNVLAPVVYLAQAKGRLAPNGALVMGRDVKLISGGDLHNAGTLRAQNDLAVTASNVDNRGLIQAGNRLELLGRDAIRNVLGGVVNGRDISLVAVTGDVTNERSVTRFDSAQDGRTWARGFAASAARVEAADMLSIQAGRDVANLGGVLKSAGNLGITAGRDITIAAVEDYQGQTRGSASSHQRISQLGGEASAGGDLSINAGRDLTALASTLEARRDVVLSAGRNVTLAAAANEEHRYSKTKKVTYQKNDVVQQGTRVEAGGDLSITAGQDLRLVASTATAGDEAYLVAGDRLDLLAADDRSEYLFDKTKKGSLGRKQTQRDEVTDVKAVGSQITSGGDLTLVSGGDQKYQGARLESGNHLALTSGGVVAFEAVKDLHQESHERSKGDLAWNRAKGKGQTDETLRQSQLVARGSVAIKAVEGLKIDIKQIDQQTVNQTIDAMVQADPELAWLKDVQQRGDVDWRKVRELHDSFKYNHSGLGSGAAIAIAIIVTYLTWGAGSAFAGVATKSAMGAAANSVVSAVASNAAVSAVNNRGNIGAVAKDVTSSDSLKSYAVSAISAGYTPTNLGAQLAVRTALNTVANGGKLKDNVTQAAISIAADALSAAIFEKVGDALVGSGLPKKVAVHAIVGGLIGEAVGGDFRTAALAAGANEALVALVGAKIFPGEAHERALAMTSQLIGVSVAAVAGGDAKDQEKAGWVAQQGAIHNSLKHETAERLLKEIKDCRTAGGCGEDKLKGILGKYEKLSAQRSNQINQCSSRQCVDEILAGSIGMQDPVAKELHALLQQKTYDTPGLLQGNPHEVMWKTPNPSGWGDSFALDKQLAFAKNLKEGWLTAAESGDLERWNASTNWVDRAVGRQLEPKEKAFILTELGGAAAMALLGGRGGIGVSGSAIPTKNATLASNGLVYKSNPKHTPGQSGNRPNAGIEPKNALEIFGSSIPSTKQYANKEVRYSVDDKGHVHRFEGSNGEFHWNGSSGDARNPLPGKHIPSEIQKKLGVKLR
ncbi:MAG: DUF637 domain-containing protein [Pseudomonas putida]|nr:DUF637 domain-containing protein [Pseudomonas putida]